MPQGSAVYATLLVGLVIGLLLIVYGEATGGDMLFVGVGGTLGLVSVAVLSLIIARLPEPESGNGHGHGHGHEPEPEHGPEPEH